MSGMESRTWQHKLTGIDDDAGLFGVKVFDYDWGDVGEIVKVRNPQYGEEHEFRVAVVVVDGQEHEFATGEFSNFNVFEEKRLFRSTAPIWRSGNLLRFMA